MNLNLKILISFAVSGLLLVGTIYLLARADNGALGASRDPQQYSNLTADTYVKKGNQGTVRGIFVASASGSPTIQVLDTNGTATSTLVNTFIPVAATYYNLGDATFVNGLYLDVGGTVDITVFYD